MSDDREPRMIDAAIAAAVASLRDVADRLEAGPRQRAAEVLMRRSDAIEGLSRQADRLLPKAKRSAWGRWFRLAP